MNFLEELAAQRYEYEGYFVRRNIRVERLARGGFAGELDVVAFHPEQKRLLHLEATMDAYSWSKRRERFKRKFEIGDRHIRSLFPGFALPNNIEQLILLGYGTNRNHPTLGTAQVVTLTEFIREIMELLETTSMATSAVPESLGLIRCLQAVSDAGDAIFE